MATEKAIAYVLRVIDFSESSCVVTLFSREFGKLRALAKGGRRPKGPFESALDLLAQCRIVFLRKSSEALDLLTEARLERRFRPAGKDLSRYYAGYYVAELTGELTHDLDPHPELFDALGDVLGALSAPDRPAAPQVLRFELTALRLLGHLPSLETCVECGQPVATDEKVAFGQLAGGVLCQRCKSGKKQVATISGRALEVLRKLAAEDNVTSTPTDLGPVSGELRGLINHYIASLLGHRPRMHAYLNWPGTP